MTAFHNQWKGILHEGFVFLCSFHCNGRGSAGRRRCVNLPLLPLMSDKFQLRQPLYGASILKKINLWVKIKLYLQSMYNA